MIASKPAHVLLIGIDAYSRSPLHGCVNDVRAIERLLVERLGVDRDRITRITSPHPGFHQDDTAPSQPATLANIRAELARLGSKAVAWDEPVFIYFSGHGTQSIIASGGSRYAREALVPVDFVRPDSTAQLLFDFELNNLLDWIGRRTPNVTVVLDCCNAAGATRHGLAPVGCSDRFLHVPEEVVVEEAAPRRGDARGIVRALTNGLASCQVVSACLADERSIEIDDAKGLRHGALTSALLAQLAPLDQADLQAVRWGAIWRGVLAGVARVSPHQHPWLQGDFGRCVFNGSGGHAPMGFGIVRRNQTYHLDAGALFGVTEGAIMAVEIAAPAEGSARLIGQVQVTSATQLTAEAIAVKDAFDVPTSAHARIEVPGVDARLAVNVDSADQAVAAKVRDLPFVHVVPSDEAEVWLVTQPAGSHLVCDDAHGTDAKNEPVLVEVPAEARERIPAVLEHYVRYRAPLRLARACTDLPGQLVVSLLSCEDHVWNSSLVPQNPALPEVAGGTGAYAYRLCGGERFCVRVENRSPYLLYVTLLNAAASGRVEYLGDASIAGCSVHTFWKHGVLGAPFEASVTTGRPIGLDRFVVIGTTKPDCSLRFLEEKLCFADVLAGRAKEAMAERTPPTAWTSQVTAVLIDARAQQGSGEGPRGPGGAPVRMNALAGLPIRRGAPDLKGVRGRHGRGLAIVVGINYGEGLELKNARNDAEAVSELLKRAHGYDTITCLDKDATLDQLSAIAEAIPTVAKDYRRIVFFFSGHGRADVTDDNQLVGSLLPCDATRDNPGTLFPMKRLRDAVEKLNATACRHVLIILDCCSAGAFARTREAAVKRLRLAHARYEWVTSHRAAQVLVSAAHDEVAFDSIAARRESDQQNSPFTGALLRALSTPDVNPNHDGVVLATDLYLSLQDELFAIQKQRLQGAQQTPMIFTLPWHEGGDFAFLLKDEPSWRHPVDLDSTSIPYVGLRPFGEADAGIFSGRTRLVEELAERVAKEEISFFLLTGASGVGKSSLLAAGLVPLLRKQHPDWVISGVLRVGSDPVGTVREALRAHLPQWNAKGAPDAAVRAWLKEKGRTLVLVLDQLEELVTRVEDEEAKTLKELIRAMVATKHVKVLGAVRVGFDAKILTLFGEKLTTFIVPPMKPWELREVIERPAEERVLFFDDHKRDDRNLVDSLLDTVDALPGSLPLLSLTLHALCLRYLKSGREDRKILWEDLDLVKGISGALTEVADSVYAHAVDAQGDAVKGPVNADQLTRHQATVQRVLLRMVESGPNGWTRRRVERAELNPASAPDAKETTERTDVVLRMLVNARLVVESKGSYELAHDLLIEGWPRLRFWLATDGERVRVTRELTDAAEAWREAGGLAMLWGDRRVTNVARLRHKQGDGLNGGRVLEPPFPQRIAEYFFPDRFVTALEPDWLTDVERTFVRKSVAWRRNKGVLAVIVAFVVIGGAAAVLFARIAVDQRSATNEVNQIAAAARLVRDEPTAVVQASMQALAAYAEREKEYQRHPPEVLGLLAEIAEHRNSLPIGAVDVPGRVVDVRVDENGMNVLVYDEDDYIRLIKLDREGHAGETLTLSKARDARFSPDGSQVACVGDDAVQIWNMATGVAATPLPLPRAFGAPTFSADSKHVAAFSRDWIARVWDLDRLDTPPFQSQQQPRITSVALNAASTRLAVVLTEDVLRRVEVGSNDSWKPLPGLGEDSTRSTTAAFSPDGLWMATGRADNQILLWLTAQEVPVGLLGGHKGNVNVVAFDPTSERVVSGGSDALCRIWNVAGRARERFAGPTVLMGSTSAIEVARFTSNGSGVAAHANGEGHVNLWSTNAVGLRLDLPHSGEVKAIAYSPDGQSILTGALDRTVRVWDAREGRLSWHHSYFSPINAVAFGPGGAWFVASFDSIDERDTDIFAKDGTKHGVLHGHEQPIVAIKVAHDGRRIATASMDGTVRIWDAAGTSLAPPLNHSPLGDGGAANRLRLHQDGVLGVAWSDNDELIVSAGANRQAKVWDARTYKEIATLVGHTDKVTSASFSANGAYVLTASQDGNAHLWQVSSGKQVVSLKGPTEHVVKARFVPGSDLAVTASDDGSTRLWQVPSGQLIRVLEGHTGPVVDIAISPSGKQLASGGQDGKVMLWNIEKGTLEASFNAHDGSVTVLAYRDDGQRVVSGGKDGFVRVFPTSAEEPLARLCEVHAKAPTATGPGREIVVPFCAIRLGL